MGLFKRRRQEKGAVPPRRPSKIELKNLGATILKRYRHPDHWTNGSSTGKAHLRKAKVLKVEEIRFGGEAFVSIEKARLNAEAIRTWATWMGLNVVQLQIDQRADKAPYVFVPLEHWDHVLKILQTL